MNKLLSMNKIMSFELPNINEEGYSLIAISFIVMCIAFFISQELGITFSFLTLLCIFFFRDPARSVPNNKHLILSPADGVISKIQKVTYPLVADKKFMLISIFLSVFNVHVNRIPISGIIKKIIYKKGKFLSALNNRSSNENEKQIIIFEDETGKEIIVEQIAGLIARRIVCNLKESQSVKAGQRFGIIKFGSRVNIYVPADIELKVSKGQKVIGGETIIANLNKETVLTFDII